MFYEVSVFWGIFFCVCFKCAKLVKKQAKPDISWVHDLFNHVCQLSGSRAMDSVPFTGYFNR